MLTSIFPDSRKIPDKVIDDVGTKTNIKFKTAYTLETVFKVTDPEISDLILFVESRSDLMYDELCDSDKEEWKNSWRMNRYFAGYLVYAVVYPSYIKRRIKLRDSKDHWKTIDISSQKGKSKMADRSRCMNIVKDMKSSVLFKDLSDFINPDISLTDFMNLQEEDEGIMFLKFREFPNSSSAHGCCASILSHLWFVTTVLGRPCSLDSVVMPISSHEVSKLLKLSKFQLDVSGKVSRFNVNWKQDVFTKLPGYKHRTYSGLFMEITTSHNYLDVYPCDVFLNYKSKMVKKSVGDQTSALCSVYSTVMVPCFDTLLSKNETCNLDPLDISSIAMEFGDTVASNISTAKTKSVFSASLGRKMNDTLKHFSAEHILIRRFLKKRLNVIKSMDPGGVKSKLAKGKMLDPRVPENVKRVKEMIHKISLNTWVPIRNMLFKIFSELLTPDLDENALCVRFIGLTPNGDDVKMAVDLGLGKADLGNVCMLFSLTMSFHRSQLLRDSKISEYRITTTGYTLSLDREIKTSGADSGGHVASTEFELNDSQSMMVHFLKYFGGSVSREFLMVNDRGSRMTQENLSSRYKSIGKTWLGLPNMTPHVMRSFWTTHAVEEGLVDSENMKDFASYLQLSSKTLMTSYVAASTNNSSHRVGKRVLGPVMLSGSGLNITTKKQKFEVGDRPNGKKLSNIRNEFIVEISETLSKYKNSTECFKTLVAHRQEGCLHPNDKWFEWLKTFWKDDDEKFFIRYTETRKLTNKK